MTSISSNESQEEEKGQYLLQQQQQQQRYDSIINNSNKNNIQQQSNDVNNNGTNEQYCNINYYYYYYLTTYEAQYNLITYVYHGEDLSLLYKYILSPLASFCVTYCTPYWLAPNSITLIGLLLMFISYCFMWYYVPTFTEQYYTNTSTGSTGTTNDESDNTNTNTIPLWIYLYNGIAILFYQTLDNMDGKQARRTKSNTSLGLLFDHGCDSINSLFGSVNWIICMKLHPLYKLHDLLLCTIILFGPYGLFYIGTWEEYYTGKLILPLANGPNEGLLGAACMSFVSYVYSPDYWQTTSTYDTIVSFIEQHVSIGTIPTTIRQLHIRNADLLVLASTIGFIQEIFSKLFIVSKRYGIHVCKTLLPFIIWILCYIVIGMLTFEYIDTNTNTNNINNNEIKNYTMIWLQIPRTSLHLCAILFVEMTIDLMLCHLTKQHYTCFRWIQLPLIILTIWIMVLYNSIEQQHQTTTMIQLIEKYYIKDYILAYASASGTYLVLKMIFIIHEICSVLNIWCFDITTPRHRGQQQSQSQVSRNHVKAE